MYSAMITQCYYKRSAQTLEAPNSSLPLQTYKASQSQPSGKIKPLQTTSHLILRGSSRPSHSSDFQTMKRAPADTAVLKNLTETSHFHLSSNVLHIRVTSRSTKL
ncbi:hypothetical protein M758_9G148000 [Ceratodon purpureus]|nr:hypothetical protein M758_9G148000 [Ceratodon purpureus]